MKRACWVDITKGMKMSERVEYEHEARGQAHLLNPSNPEVLNFSDKQSMKSLNSQVTGGMTYTTAFLTFLGDTAYMPGKLTAAFFAIFYIDDGYLASRDSEFLQRALDILIDLFARVGLKTNVKKTQTMICTPGRIRTQLPMASYARMREGLTTAEEWDSRKVQHHQCNKMMSATSLCRHLADQQGLPTGGGGRGALRSMSGHDLSRTSRPGGRAQMPRPWMCREVTRRVDALATLQGPTPPCQGGGLDGRVFPAV